MHINLLEEVIKSSRHDAEYKMYKELVEHTKDLGNSNLFSGNSSPRKIQKAGNAMCFLKIGSSEWLEVLGEGAINKCSGFVL